MKVAFLGAGRMGSTILKMMQRAKLPLTAEVCEPDEKVRAALAKELKGVKLVAKAEELAEPEAVLLAVKPKMLKETAAWLKGRKESYLLISILAGVETGKLAKEAGPKARVERTTGTAPSCAAPRRLPRHRGRPASPRWRRRRPS